MRSTIAIAAAITVLLLGGCASSGHQLIGQARPAIPVEQVKVYQVMPRRYEEIARLNATSAVGFGTQGQTNAAIERMRREAAKLGANGVLVLGTGTVGSPVGMSVGGGSWGSHGGAGVSAGIPTAQRQAEGVAIHVIEE
jgi:hypothetical protein